MLNYVSFLEMSNPDMSSMATSASTASMAEEQKKIKQILDSVVESNAIPLKVNNNKNSSTKKAAKNAKIYDNTNQSIVYLANDYKKMSIHSKSSDLDDDYLENVMNAKDRRASWSQVRTQRSYIPSLTAICMYKNRIFFYLFFLTHT